MKGADRGLGARRRGLAVLVVACVLCTGAGAAAAVLVKSPAQAAAESAPPPPDILTAKAEKRVISQAVIARGVVTASRHIEVTPGPQSDKDIGRSVVTKVRTAAGQKATTGQVLLEISGRPLFVLPGAVPAYRDLSWGKSGDDVGQLQRALQAVGHPTGTDRSGVFGPGTEQAVASFYRSIGYEAPTVEVPAAPRASPDPAGEEEPGNETPVSRTPVVPLSEVVFVESFPARVDDLRVKVGDEPGASLLSLSSGALTVEGTVTPQERDMIRSGQLVHIYSELMGRQFEGKVTSVGEAAAQGEDGDQLSGGEKYTVKVAPSQPLQAKLDGENVQLTIVAASSGDKVLVVPSSALSTGADGLTSVTERLGAEERRIPVAVGVSGDGFVQVTPQNGYRLDPGADVVVGTQR
ncbi:peptidoglycan-binding protein [Streptomyces sp. NPDC019531]|uniref:peptidoglycan-binding protein n=1 Tax=Streptomyces sp. NPDC019531 TaxID=3365062 RepID=UPI00384A52CE